MLRYVSRRIKDTVERTCNVLETKPWFYPGNEGVGAYDGGQSLYDLNKQFQRHFEKRSSNSVFEFGLEPKIPTNQNVVKKKNCRGSVCSFKAKFASSDSGSSSSDNKEDFRERIHRKHHCKFQKNFVDALTWVNLCNFTCMNSS